MNPRPETIQWSRPPIQRHVAPETAARAHALPLIEKGVTPKNNVCILYSIQYGDFLLFLYSFDCNYQDANQLLPTDLTGRQFPAHSASAADLPAPTPTWDCRRDTQYPGCQGICTGTGHPVGGPQRF